MKKKILFSILFALILPPILIPFFQPWTEINCRHQEINIKTGQARYSRYLWFIQISEEIKDTSISKSLNKKIVDNKKIKDWHRVNTFTISQNHSPHYTFHSAFSQARTFTYSCAYLGLDEKERYHYAQSILIAWQTKKSDSAADEILQILEEQTSSQEPHPNFQKIYEKVKF